MVSLSGLSRGMQRRVVAPASSGDGAGRGEPAGAGWANSMRPHNFARSALPARSASGVRQSELCESLARLTVWSAERKTRRWCHLPGIISFREIHTPSACGRAWRNRPFRNRRRHRPCRRDRLRKRPLSRYGRAGNGHRTQIRLYGRPEPLRPRARARQERRRSESRQKSNNKWRERHV